LTPGPRIRDPEYVLSGYRISDPKPIFFRKKFYIFFENWPKFFSSAFQNKIIFNFVKFVATKKGMTKNFFSPLSFFAIFGSGMGKNQDPGSGIINPDPQH
jgi:hypothetical protein